MISLSGSALRGVAWNWSGSAVLVVAQIATTVVTARLVSPREFGLYATAQAAAALLGFFSLNAVGQGLQRRSSLGAGTAGTALLISLASSFILATALWVGASLWAVVWGVPDAALSVRVLAIAMFLRSAAAVPLALIRRDLRFGNAAVIETGGVVLGMLAGVGFAVAMHSAVALAIGQAVGAAALLAAAFLTVDLRLRLSFDRTDGRELAFFAGQVGGLGFISYAVNTAPSWFISRVLGAPALGVYSRATLIANLPAEYAVTSIYKVIYPLYGRVKGDRARTAVMVEEALSLATGFLWPAFAILAGAAPLVVTVFLGPQWTAVPDVLTVCAIGACARVPTGLLTNAAEAFGWMRAIALRLVALLALVVAALLVVYLTEAPLIWVAVGVGFAEWVVLAVTTDAFVRRGILDSRSTLRTQAVHFALAIVAFCGSALFARVLADVPLALGIGGEVVFCGLLVSVYAGGRGWIPAMAVLARRLEAAR